ncbi:arsenate reductase ArsC [Listeria costaricensis]|uniref:arsenate reductase ArsC n=1 Tax=Listeria costaricensis TaxID=2026604 RepID=UPI000C0847FF|nr:arsenate reductase ArsC [Listeria costaricensis]
MLKIAFICIHNSCRSQIAEALGRKHLEGVAEVYSAGTEAYPEVKPLAIAVIKEYGLDPSSQHPKLLQDIPEQLDILITMGCGVSCPAVPAKHREDWGLSDPSGGPIEDFRITRDLIEAKILELKERISRNEFENGMDTPGAI